MVRVYVKWWFSRVPLTQRICYKRRFDWTVILRLQTVTSGFMAYALWSHGVIYSFFFFLANVKDKIPLVSASWSHSRTTARVWYAWEFSSIDRILPMTRSTRWFVSCERTLNDPNRIEIPTPTPLWKTCISKHCHRETFSAPYAKFRLIPSRPRAWDRNCVTQAFPKNRNLIIGSTGFSVRTFLGYQGPANLNMSPTYIL